MKFIALGATHRHNKHIKGTNYNLAMSDLTGMSNFGLFYNKTSLAKGCKTNLWENPARRRSIKGKTWSVPNRQFN